ncbi:acetolactate synthase small subunit [Candidatus Daviesbacteria bacterium]|nr:acetolactate synthase small subunit [Candidatus Daviesbacteria bacterium]
MNITITIYSENKPGVLYRIANLFLRRKVNIESLTVSEIKSEDRSRFTIVVKEDLSLVAKIAKQLERIIEVSSVEIHTDNELIFKDAALIKISKNPKVVKKLDSIISLLKASIAYQNDKYIIIEKLGTEEDIDLLVSTLEPFVKETVKSGRIALPKNGQ